jgi:hypothetical protein
MGAPSRPASREQSEAALRAAVDSLAETANPKRRMDACRELIRCAEHELARVRHESRAWAMKVAEHAWQRIAANPAPDDADIRAALADVAGDMSDVADATFDTFTPSAADVKLVRGSGVGRIGGPWLVALLGLRTGALDLPLTAAPKLADVKHAAATLRKTKRATT